MTAPRPAWPPSAFPSAEEARRTLGPFEIGIAVTALAVIAVATAIAVAAVTGTWLAVLAVPVPIIGVPAFMAGPALADRDRA